MQQETETNSTTQEPNTEAADAQQDTARVGDHAKSAQSEADDAPETEDKAA